MSDSGASHESAGETGPVRRVWAIGGILCVLYLPQMWCLTMDYSWNDYRLFWLRFFPGLPAFLPGALLPFPGPNAMAVGMAGITAAAAFGAYRAGRRAERRLYLVLGILFVWSVISAVAAHAVFRA